MEAWKLLDKRRLEVFTDAIIAIILTILVLDIKVPIIEAANDHDLLQGLIHQLPHFYSFLISFAVILVIWTSHHDLFASLKYSTRSFGAINFAFVGSLATLPFSTALAGEYPARPLALAILAGNMLIMNIFLTALWIYAAVNNLTDFSYYPEWRSKIKRSIGQLGVLIFLIATIMAWVSTTVSIILLALVPLMHSIPLKQPKKAAVVPGPSAQKTPKAEH